MRIIVKAKPKSKKESMERVNQPMLDLSLGGQELVEYKVSVKEVPVAGKANEAIIKALAKYFEVAPSLIKLISGNTSKKKIFQIPD